MDYGEHPVRTVILGPLWSIIGNYLSEESDLKAERSKPSPGELERRQFERSEIAAQHLSFVPGRRSSLELRSRNECVKAFQVRVLIK